MLEKKRRGNLLITVLVFVVVVMMLTSIFGILSGQTASARFKAGKAGETQSYITLANMCANAFQKDLEGQATRITMADVEHPDGDWGTEIYDKAIADIQKAIQLGNTDTNGNWKHTLSKPSDIIQYAGIPADNPLGIGNPANAAEAAQFELNKARSHALEEMKDLLEDSKVSITVEAPLEIFHGAEENQELLQNGDTLLIQDILFDLVMTKGTTKVTQSYRLSGEKLIGRFTMSNEASAPEGGTSTGVAKPVSVWCTIDSTSAVCNLESQMVTRSNIN